MKSKLLITIGVFIFSPFFAFSQVNEISVTGTFAEHEGSISVMGGHDWELGKAKRFAIGTGIRFTSYFGANQYYETAPAKLTSGSTGPFVIFKENIEENIDTFLIKSPQVNSLNIFINLRYKISNKFQVGFNIDAIGFSFGSTTSGNYINRSQSAVGFMEDAKPTPFNILLISDNDNGSLNSELYGKYYFNDSWAVKLSASFLFTEYTTDSNVQQYPEPNDRFRNKSLMLGLGVTYKLK